MTFAMKATMIIILILQIATSYGQVKTTYYANGNKESEGKLGVQNELIGLWIYWHSNGEKAEETLYSDTGMFVLNTWSIDGIEMVKDGNGIDSTYNCVEKKQYTLDNYENGILISRICYNKRNRKSFMYECSNWIFHGTYLIWYENGQLADSGSYLNNSKERLWKSWYKNSQISEVGEYSNGIKNGDWIYYDKKGQVKCKASYWPDTTVNIKCFEYYNNMDIKITKENKTRFIEEREDCIIQGNVFVEIHCLSIDELLKNSKWIYYSKNGDILKIENR